MRGTSPEGRGVSRRAFAALARAQWKAFIRDRQVMFWMLAFPLAFLLLFGAINSSDGEASRTKLLEVGPDWMLVVEPGARHALVPLGAVQALAGVAGHISPTGAEVERRLRLGSALRALGRDRAEVQVHTSGRTLVGRIDRVGADHVDVGAGRGGPVWTVPLAALRVVRSR